jgi:hypothetical protein
VARVQYANPAAGVNILKAMTPPKNVESLDAWILAARRAIPEVPRGFTLKHHLVTVNTICLHYVSNKQEKYALVIDRKG